MGRSVRGIRDSLPPGTVVGRGRGGRGRGSAELLTLNELVNEVHSAGGNGGQQAQGLSSISDATILSNISGGAGLPVGNTLTAILDYILGSAQGDIIYRNASTWVVLTPGTLGQYLKSGGAAANVSWATLPATGSIATDSDVSLSGLANKDLLWYQTSDSKWHNTTLTALLDSALGSTQGNLVYRNSTVWTVLAPGTAATVLLTGGAAANPSWSTHVYDTSNTFVYSVSGEIPTAAVFQGEFFSVPAAAAAGGMALISYADSGYNIRQYNLGGGTIASPTTIGSSKALFTNSGFGWNGSAYTRGGSFRYRTSAAWTGSNNECKFEIDTVNPGTTSVKRCVEFQRGIAVFDASGVTPTGGDKGGGTVNVADATGYYINGTALLDSLLGATQGQIAYRGSSAWTVLAPGTSGQFLETQGAAANPVWASPSGVAGGAGLWAAVMSGVPTQSGTGLSTWYNQLGSSTVTDNATGVTVFAVSNGSTNKISAIQKNSAGSGTAQKYKALIARTASAPNFTGWVFGWSDGTKAQTIGLNGNGSGITVVNWTNATTLSATVISNAYAGFPLSPIWIKLEDDATNIVFSFGWDGVSWVDLYSVARASGFLGSTGYTKIIFGTNAYDALLYATLMSYTQGT